jgi:hypothetical protein
MDHRLAAEVYLAIGSRDRTSDPPAVSSTRHFRVLTACASTSAEQSSWAPHGKPAQTLLDLTEDHRGIVL